MIGNAPPSEAADLNAPRHRRTPFSDFTATEFKRIEASFLNFSLNGFMRQWYGFLRPFCEASSSGFTADLRGFYVHTELG